MPFVPCKGHFHKYTPSSGGSGGEGFFTVSGLSGEGILIQGLSLEDKDVVLPVVTLENHRILYSFGAEFGSVGIIGMILLGEAGGGGGEAFKKVVDYFNSKRVSADKGSAVDVTGPGGAGWKVYITGLSVSEPDPQLHIQPFVLIGQIAEPA